MKVVIDTNVLVSAALKDREPEVVNTAVISVSLFKKLVCDAAR